MLHTLEYCGLWPPADLGLPAHGRARLHRRLARVALADELRLQRGDGVRWRWDGMTRDGKAAAPPAAWR